MSNPSLARLEFNRVSTGSSGLDDILNGGLPAERLYLVQGNPGTGKTTLALQFLIEGVRRGEKVLYITLSETRAELEQVVASHGWSLDGITLYELEGVEERLGPDEQYTFFHPAEVELGETTKKIYERIVEAQPSRVVFDSLSEFRLLARDSLRYRRQVLGLKQFFVGRKCTVLLLDDRTSNDNELQLQSIAHGVMSLESVSTDHGSTPRRLLVNKMRGVKFLEGYHDLEIRRGGLAVFPRLIAASRRDSPTVAAHLEHLVKSGVKELDSLLGGGFSQGSSVLLLGPSGAGKSSLVAQYLSETIKRGAHAACYLFEEGAASFFRRSAGFGLNLKPAVESGQIVVDQIDPQTLSPGEFAFRVKQEVENHKPEFIAIDSLNGYLNAMPSYRFLLLQMHELLTYLNDRGVLTFLVMTQHGFMGGGMQTPIDVSYIADSVLMLRYFEANGAVRKAISVLKKRSGAHENQIREFRITGSGLQIGKPLDEFRGVLTGVPAYVGNADPLMKSVGE